MSVFSIPHVKNVGELDRGIRALLALANIALIFSPSLIGLAQIPLVLTATLLAVSSYTGYCFIYYYFGLCSCEGGRPVPTDKHIHK